MWNRKMLEQLLQAGKIRGYKLPAMSKNRKLPALEPVSKEKSWLRWQMQAWCLHKNYQLTSEIQFSKPRRWRFDFAIEEIMIAIEYEGIFSRKSRHTTATGYTGDTEKYNTAQALGWRVIRLTAMNYKTIIQTLDSYVAADALRKDADRSM